MLLLSLFQGSPIDRDVEISEDAFSPKAFARGLSQRQSEVLQHAAWGKTNAEIAAALHISTETVKTHICNALYQLNAKSRTEAVAIALRAGAIV